MSSDRVTLEVSERGADQVGSRRVRRLRKEGLVPGVLYGSGKPRAFFVAERELRRALGGGHGMHQILDVVVGDQQKAHHAVLKDYQLDPRRSTLVHVDLHEVRLDRPIQAEVTVELVGTPEGVKSGGLLSQTLREVNVEALPMAMPDRIELDVSALEIGDSVKVADLRAPEGAAILDDPETTVASVVVPRRVEIEEVPEEAEEIEGEAPAEAEGEAPAEAEAEAAAE